MFVSAAFSLAASQCSSCFPLKSFTLQTLGEAQKPPGEEALHAQDSASIEAPPCSHEALPKSRCRLVFVSHVPVSQVTARLCAHLPARGCGQRAGQQFSKTCPTEPLRALFLSHYGFRPPKNSGRTWSRLIFSHTSTRALGARRTRWEEKVATR